MSEKPIDLVESAPGHWETKATAKARKIVRQVLERSAFTKRLRPSSFHRHVHKLPLAVRMVIFILIMSAMIGLLFGLKPVAQWLLYSG